MFVSIGKPTADDLLAGTEKQLFSVILDGVRERRKKLLKFFLDFLGGGALIGNSETTADERTRT